MQSTLFPFMLFAFVASITPGPTNILVLSNSARYGFTAALPIIFGACAGAAGIVLLVGCGIGQSLVQMPKVQTAMQWVGVVWLSVPAWRIFSAPAQAIQADARQEPLGLSGAAALQLVNPKTWVMALAVVSVFAGTGAQRESQVMYLSLVFFLISLPCLGLWALLGSGSARILRSARAMQWFNRAMALVLLAATWVSVFR